MARRWEILYSYRETPDRLLFFAAFDTRKAARVKLASIAARCQAAGNVVEWDGPDNLTHSTRTAYTIRRRRTHDALGRAVVRVLAIAGLVAALTFGGRPVAAEELPGAGCFTSADPAEWQTEVSAMGPAQLATLDDCLDLAGWSFDVDDDTGDVSRHGPVARPPGWPCAYDADTVDGLTAQEWTELRRCLDAFGWTHDDDDTGTGAGTPTGER